jgi:hypothetical protein
MIIFLAPILNFVYYFLISYALHYLYKIDGSESLSLLLISSVKKRGQHLCEIKKIKR